jgi:hypothetical protein
MPGFGVNQCGNWILFHTLFISVIMILWLKEILIILLIISCIDLIIYSSKIISSICHWPNDFITLSFMNGIFRSVLCTFEWKRASFFSLGKKIISNNQHFEKFQHIHVFIIHGYLVCVVISLNLPTLISH